MASVQQHRNRWRVKWHDETGRALYESFPTKKEADDAARRIEARALLDGKPPVTYDDTALTLAKWWERWEPGQDWKPLTRTSHASHWRRYIKPVFGPMPLEQITSADIRRWHAKLRERELAPRTIGVIHNTLSAVLQGAVADGLIVRNAARDARLKKRPAVPPVALDPETLRNMLDAIAVVNPDADVFARVIAATGLRRAEAAGLTWDRVDLDAGMLTVDRQLDMDSPVSRPKWTTTKTGKTRVVPLASSTVDLLRSHRAAQSVVSLSGLVFMTPEGTAWGRSGLRLTWIRAAAMLAKQGTPLPEGARGWHTLRHTVASRLLEAGVPPAEAAQALGHTPSQLLTVYAHVVDHSAADARLRAALE